LNIHPINGSRRWCRFLFSGTIALVIGALSWTVEGDCHGQRRTTWFFWKEGVSAADMHRRLPTCVVGRQPCVETLPLDVEEHFDGLRRQVKSARQVLLLRDNARPHSSKHHKNWYPLDIPSYHMHHILQLWLHRTMLCSTK
jgi:hypothetical protein